MVFNLTHSLSLKCGTHTFCTLTCSMKVSVLVLFSFKCNYILFVGSQHAILTAPDSTGACSLKMDKLQYRQHT